MMITRIEKAMLGLVFAVAAIIGFGAAGSPTEAHSITYMGDKPFAVDPTLRLGNLQASLDGTAAERAQTAARANDAIAEINGVSGSTFDYQYSYFNSSIIWTGSTCSTAAWGNVTVVTYNISSLGRTSWCTTSTQITRAAIRVDFRTWDNNGGTVASGVYDLESLLVHEMVHAAGFGRGSAPDHFTDSSACPGGSLNNTMCSGLPSGTIWKRTLGTHDEHTLADFY